MVYLKKVIKKIKNIIIFWNKVLFKLQKRLDEMKKRDPFIYK